VEFASTIPEALRELTHGVFDVVVADATARGLDNGTFLDEVAARQPRAIRFLLSASGGHGMVMRAAGSAHQHLGKPLTPQAVFARIGDTLALGDLLSSAHLKCLVSRLRSVPSLPTVYLAIMAELRKDEPSAQRVGQFVAKDAGMSAKLLQLVNSPFFGVQMPVTEPAAAVNLLGLETVRALVLSLHIFNQLDRRSVVRFRLGRVWRHSLATSGFARMIARLREADPETLGEAFTAGLLHDIGKLVLASSLPNEYAAALEKAEREGMPHWVAEQEILECTHAEVGAYLLGLWGLPESIVQAVAWHHRPSASSSARFCPIGCIHVADVIEHDAHRADTIGRPPELEAEYLDRLELSWQYPTWRAACMDATGEDQGWGLAARL
jgi:putative nucleotidyltransferase with HDIG domain